MTLDQKLSHLAANSPLSHGSIRHWVGLCAVCFFLAEVDGVTMPFLTTYLTSEGWRYDVIGSVIAIGGLTSWLMSVPAGLLIDHYHHRRLMLITISLLVGCSIGGIPLVPPSITCIGALLIAAAMGRPFFGPLTNCLTLDLAGIERIDFAMGVNQAWNHAGNIFAAALAIGLVHFFSINYVFYSTSLISALAAVSVLLIPHREQHHRKTTAEMREMAQNAVRFMDLLSDRRVTVLLASTTLFHLANAPVMPMVAQKIQFVGGSHTQVALVVLVAQVVMVPTSIVAGLMASRWGHKAMLSLGFIVLPIRIILYSLTDQPVQLVAVQALDGIGAGIFGVSAVILCADVSRGAGHFNALVGALGTAGGFGGVVGPLIGGSLIQHWGFNAAFMVFAIIATLAAVLLIGWMPGQLIREGLALMPASPTMTESWKNKIETGRSEATT